MSAAGLISDVIQPLSIVLGTFLLMEGVAWAAHKYVMHGPGWAWHESHHRPRTGAFERNDLYGAVFALIAMALFAAGAAWWPPAWWIACGMTLYGAFYYIVHDGLVHQRWPFRIHPRSGYLKRLVDAHRVHHAVHEKEGCVGFGFLYAPPPERLRKELHAARQR